MDFLGLFKRTKDTTPVTPPSGQPTGSGTTATPAYPRENNADWNKKTQGYRGGYLTNKKSKTDLLDEADK